MQIGDRVKLNNGHFGIIVNADLIQSHAGVTVLTYCDFIKEERPQFIKCSQLNATASKQQSLADDLEDIIGAMK